MKSIKEIKEICSKKVQRDPGHLALYRKISFPITALICDLPISADMVTLFSYFLYLVGCAVLIFVSWPWNILGPLLFYAALVLDYVDGNIARYKKQGSLGGAFLDSLGHGLIPAMMFFSIVFASATGIKFTSFNVPFLIVNPVGCGLWVAFFFIAGREALGKSDILLYRAGIKGPGKNQGGSILGLPTFHVYEFVFIFTIVNKLEWLALFYLAWMPIRYFGILLFTFINLKKHSIWKE